MGIDSLSYVAAIGLLTCLFSFSGYEGGAHMAEETKKASVSAPRGIILTCIMTGITGFVYIVGLLYAAQGQIDTFSSGVSNYPVANLFVLSFT